MDTKKLRQKILDLAIRGKLVPQDPNDEPASVLLEQIKAKKERLIKEGKIKKSKKSVKTSDTPHYGNVPFEVPDGWCWCRLDDLAFYKKGPFGSSLTKSMFVPDSPNAYKVYEQKNAISKDATLGHYFIDKDKYDELKGFAVQPEDIIVSCAGTIGETYVLPLNIREGIINQALMTIRLFDKSISNFYLLYFDFILKREAAKESKGTAIKNIPPFDILKNFFIPLPPPKEQIRIIEKVSYWLSFVDAIDSEESEMSNLISKTKSKILDLAIHGKLVLQDPNDEPAIELLKRINPDFTPCDNGHYTFDVPSGWITTNLGSIFNVVSAKRILKSDWKHSGVPFYRAREIAKLSIYGLVDNELYISEEHYNSLKEKFPVPKASDIMISAVGTIGKCYIVKESDKFYYKDASVLCLCNDYQINTKYIYHIMRSEYMLKQMYDNSKGTTVDTITIEKAKQYILPLPPLAEQQRIVAKIEETFSIFDGIQNSLEA